MVMVKKGTAKQLIDGDGVYSQLYDVYEGDNGEERVLKDCFSFNSCFRFVVGCHITLEAIAMFSQGTKKHNGKRLMRNGAILLRNLKKSLKIVEALSPHIVQVHPQTLRVLSFSSGQNVTSFMRKVNDGMFSVCSDEQFVRKANKTGKDVHDEVVAERDVADWDPFGGVEFKLMKIGHSTDTLRSESWVPLLHLELLMRQHTTVDFCSRL